MRRIKSRLIVLGLAVALFQIPCSLHGEAAAPSDGEIVKIARAYIRHHPNVYLKDQPVSFSDDRLTRLGLSSMPFETIPPARILHFTPERVKAQDRRLDDRYVVYWTFGEECEYRGEGSGLSAGWFLRNGSPCFHNRYEVAVVLSPALQPERVEIQPKMSMTTGPHAVAPPVPVPPKP